MADPPNHTHDNAARPSWRVGLALMALFLVLALVQSHPLWQHLAQGIPYGYRVVPGYELVPEMPGDHLQFLYWCWLMTDNVFGPSVIFTNPYEFNTFLSPGLPGFANFPFSLLYLATDPMGQAAGYNALVLFSYLVSGLAAYLLGRQLFASRAAALVPALVFALLPFRAAQVLSGHLFGFVAFLLPLCLWCLERGWRRASWLWGLAAGACLLVMAMMEAHLVYYSALMLGLYVPLRLLVSDREEEAASGSPGQMLGPVLAALGVSVMAQTFVAREGGAFWSSGLVQVVGVYLILALVVWLALGWVVAAFSKLDPGRARGAVGWAMAPLVLLALYAVQLKGDVAHLGTALILVAGLAGLAILARAWWPRRACPRLTQGAWAPVLPLALGLALGAARLIMVKATSWDDSIAGGGRGLSDVLLFAPRLGDLVDPANPNMERLVHLGWITMGLAAVGLVLLVLGRKSGMRGAARAAVWSLVGVVMLFLSLGPTLSWAPLYEALYHHLPFFNFPRVPGRMVIFGALMLSLVAAWVVDGLLRRPQVSKAWSWALGGAFALALVMELGLPARTGVCLLPPAERMAAAVKANMITGPGSPDRLLGLPIWPGDSHQSSVYELMISRTRAPMVNGYSPVVPRAYVREVFDPLYPLDLGLLDGPALATLNKLGVRLVAFYEDELVFARKVSPFPPALSRQRLLASGAFHFITQEDNVFLLGVNPGPHPDPHPGRVPSPVTSLWEAENLHRDTGHLVEEVAASGHGLLFDEPPLDQPGGPMGPRRALMGNVVQAREGRDPEGFLSFGPYRAYPPGTYQAVFRLRRPQGGGAPPGDWIEVSTDEGRVSLARSNLGPAELPDDDQWHDLTLDFRLIRPTVLELRTFYAGRGDLDLDVVLVRFSQGAPKDGFYRAQDLWRQTGRLVHDAWVSGGLAVRARAEYDPPLYMMHGPQATLEPGRYLAVFRVAPHGDPKPGAAAADIVVATDLGRRVLAYKRLTGADLDQGYHDFPLEFTLERRCEVGLRVRFAGEVSLRLAGATLLKQD